MLIPKAEIASPPHQHNVATTPALRGPARSSQPPSMNAAEPRNTKKRMKVHCNSEIRQSQVLLTARASRPLSSGHLIEVVMPIAFESGSQKTEKPYAIPMQR